MSLAFAVLTPDEVRRLVREAVREELAVRPTAPDWLSDVEAAALLGFARSYVGYLARTRELPAHKAGRSWRFRRDELEHWLEVNRG